ncbi:3-oxoacyl-[acyl-carrier protein] reductase [Fusobacterium sp. PH5-7]|uniref:SDR family oxidoreductase n=1 Tax=Fusobacterium sp. PH5-7 TaxID=2940528 RepID=UPI002476FD6D|nr:SDR family oxidoreductase [Fusobacterium sp. PH5-7]MDH6458385.1 3-oxoacyl-[acyl-carrier protein] reductase [Fusobacterium sp. PH5-7]
MKEALLITGATSDLGYGYLKKFKDKNITIIAFYYDFEERLDDLIENYGLNIVKIYFDFLCLDNLEEKVKELSEKYFISKVLHLSAPIVKQERFNKISKEVFYNDFTIQVVSLVEILKIVLLRMKKEKKGKIVIILSSCVEGVPPKFWTSYVTSKYAMMGFLKSLVSEYGQFNIQINGISPSMIQSKFLNNMDERMVEMEIEKHPMKRTVTIAEVAETIDYLFFNNNSFLNGNNILLTGGENF